MIEIVYDRAGRRLSMRGHAGGEPGRDTVCAAASMLAYTLAANAAKLAGEKLIKLENGRAEIALSPEKGAESRSAQVFDTVCEGFRLLAESFPGKVRFEVKVKNE